MNNYRQHTMLSLHMLISSGKCLNHHCHVLTDGLLPSVPSFWANAKFEWWSHVFLMFRTALDLDVEADLSTGLQLTSFPLDLSCSS